MTDTKFGLALPYGSARPVAELCQLAEEAGWDGCFLGDANRSLSTPFDIVVSGKTAGLDHNQMQDKLLPWVEAGVTWWVEGLWAEPEDQVRERIRQGPPRLD